jgi:hypothetical protein
MAGYLAEFGAGVTVEQVLRDVGANIKGTLDATASLVPSEAEYRALVSVTRPSLQRRFASAFKRSCSSLIARLLRELGP